nr:immunoglobulin light chain junction region [Mus musculus]NSL97777.1 immunoglobulin light chain junction region [Mus musculus]NSL98192.1 immunoglobulin light chain junction region [Mus musculus]NSL98506.1 immunoglobulin light chain junction region [Mus musculus]NSL99806.1 immunoglobulin light chain junction region [Mus musculus]
CHQYLSSYTF